MIEKRFIDKIKNGTVVIIDKKDNVLIRDKYRACDYLNRLNNEIEELKQFQEDVFAKIDMHLRMLPTAVDNEFNEEDGDPSLYTGAIYMLETLKKELQRDDL